MLAGRLALVDACSHCASAQAALNHLEIPGLALTSPEKMNIASFTNHLTRAGVLAPDLGDALPSRLAFAKELGNQILFRFVRSDMTGSTAGSAKGASHEHPSHTPDHLRQNLVGGWCAVDETLALATAMRDAAPGLRSFGGASAFLYRLPYLRDHHRNQAVILNGGKGMNMNNMTDVASGRRRSAQEPAGRRCRATRFRRLCGAAFGGLTVVAVTLAGGSASAAGEGWVDDRNGDGILDMIFADVSGDGVSDIELYDDNQDGWADNGIMDLNYDHYFEVFAIDMSGNGMMDSFAFDIDANGTADIFYTDSNEDGVEDFGAPSTAPVVDATDAVTANINTFVLMNQNNQIDTTPWVLQ